MDKILQDTFRDMEKKNMSQGRFTSFFIKDIIASDEDIKNREMKNNLTGENNSFYKFLCSESQIILLNLASLNLASCLGFF